MQGSILASASRILWRLLLARELDAVAVFQQAGMDPKLLSEPRIRYPVDSVLQAWIEAAVLTSNDSIGLEAVPFYSPLDISALGVSFLSSSSLIEALKRLDRFESILNSNLDFAVVEAEGRIDLLSDAKFDSEQGARIAEDLRMSIVLDLCREGFSGSLTPVEVAFTYAEPKDTQRHIEIFGCPLVFSQGVARISFSVADAQRPFTASNRELALGNDQMLEKMLKELKSSDLVSQVKRVIVEYLPSGTPSESDIAKRLMVSSRTLQRKLADNDTNFRALLLEVRRELARYYMADKTIPLSEISYMLGFSDASSFSRAFKTWTGDSPALFRTNLS